MYFSEGLEGVSIFSGGNEYVLVIIHWHHCCRSTDKVYTEHMVVNPIYSEQSGEFNNSISVAANPQYGTRAEVIQGQVATYEDIKDFPHRPEGKSALSSQ